MKVRARAAVTGFGRRVRERRMAMGISQPELGKRSRVTAKFIGQIERGTSNPSLVTMALVAGALDCNLTDLLRPWSESEPYVSLTVENLKRAREALAVIGSMLAERKNAPRKPRAKYSLR